VPKRRVVVLKFKPGRLPVLLEKRGEEPPLALTREAEPAVARRVVVLKFKPGRLPYFL
jgi:hypothetical protein